MVMIVAEFRDPLFISSPEIQSMAQTIRGSEDREKVSGLQSKRAIATG